MDQPTAGGYGLLGQNVTEEVPPRPAGAKKKEKRPLGEAPGPPRKRGPMADGVLPPLDQPERMWFLSILYPLRGAECLGVIAVLAVVSWVFFLLVPEYCIRLMADADSMGAGILGNLFVMITGMPVVFLSPLLLSYALQYLARVLVSSAMGETTPPQAPHRNFDGFFHGLSPWFVWFILGLGVGLMPAWWYVFSRGAKSASPAIALLLTLAGLPYVLAALMLSFLHDNSLPPKPWTVLIELFRMGPSFLALSAFIVVAGAVAFAPFGLALLIRPHVFWLYLLLGLGCWVIVHWLLIVVMRLLGTFYYHHKDVLRWHRTHPRWGVAWRL